MGDFEANQKIYLEEIFEIGRRFSKIGTIPEYDWIKIKELEFQEKLREKRILLESLSNFQCCKCPDLNIHVSAKSFKC